MSNNNSNAHNIAIAALSFVAGDHTLLRRFLDISGIEASSIREAAAEPGFLAGVLQFITAHEPTLLAFSAESGIEPEAIVAAMRDLPGGEDRYQSSI